MFKPTYTRAVPASAKTRIVDGVTEVLISHDGRMQWFPLSKGGRARIPHKDWHGLVKLADGRTITIRLVKNKDAAQRILNNRQQREDNIASGKELATVETKKTLADYVQQFEQERIAQGISLKTRQNTLPALKKALKALMLESVADLRGLTPEQLSDWFLELRYAPGTKAKIVEVVRQFMRWMIEKNLLAALPRFPKVSTQITKKRRALNFEEVEQLASASPWPRSILYRLAFATLARRSALIALTVDDLVISLKGGATILLRPEEAKTKQGQQVPVPQRLLNDLKRLAKESETGRLFEKVMRNNFSLTFDADLLAAKIPKNTTDGIASFHSLRHGGTTHLIRSGVPMVLVQRMGGWQSINILAKHYSHLTPISDREQIDRAMSPQTKKLEKS